MGTMPCEMMTSFAILPVSWHSYTLELMTSAPLTRSHRSKQLRPGFTDGYLVVLQSNTIGRIDDIHREHRGTPERIE